MALSIYTPFVQASSQIEKLHEFVAAESSKLVALFDVLSNATQASVTRTPPNLAKDKTINELTAFQKFDEFQEKMNAMAIRAKAGLNAVNAKMKHLQRLTTSAVLFVRSLCSAGRSNARTHGARSHKSTSKSSGKKSSSDSDGSGEPPSYPFISSFILSVPYHLSVALAGILSSSSARNLKSLLKNVLFQLAHSSSSDCQYLALNKTNSDRILRLAEVMLITGLSRSHIYNLCTPGKYYDPTFPKKIKLSLRAIGFLESEVKAWVLSRKEQTN